MTITPHTRCVGNANPVRGGPICPVRDTCGRHQAMEARGILLVDVRALLCNSPDFRYRTEGQALPSPKCDDVEAVESVRSDTEAADE